MLQALKLVYYGYYAKYQTALPLPSSPALMIRPIYPPLSPPMLLFYTDYTDYARAFYSTAYLRNDFRRYDTMQNGVMMTTVSSNGM